MLCTKYACRICLIVARLHNFIGSTGVLFCMQEILHVMDDDITSYDIRIMYVQCDIAVISYCAKNVGLYNIMHTSHDRLHVILFMIYNIVNGI